MKNKAKKRKYEEIVEEKPQPLPAVRHSDQPIEKKGKWVNKQRVLVFASRGINYRDRHLMEDLKKLMPHNKAEAKMERTKTLSIINEMCEMKNCNKAMMFEGRKKRDLYLWLSNVPSGPSVKFLVENVHTMGELKMTGNCLRGSRPILSFDPAFAEKQHYVLLKELLSQIFGIPKHHPRSQPFFDHVYTFTILDNRIWFRNFQILSEDGALAEVGPRFVLNPVKIFSGSFGGVALWENPVYVSPANYRQQIRLVAKNKYVNRVQQKVHAENTRPTDSYKLTPLQDIFQGDPLEKARDLEKTKKPDDEVKNDMEPAVVKKKKNKLKINGQVGDKTMKKKKIKTSKVSSPDNNVEKKVPIKKKALRNKANKISGSTKKESNSPKIKLKTRLKTKKV